MRRHLAWFLAASALAGAVYTGRSDEPFSDQAAELELLYLPNGRHLKVLSLGHASLVADAIYLWAIQHYSDYSRENRGRYVEHVFGDVIAELDPRFVDPYSLGSLILIVENRDLEAGLRLLDKGFAANPDEWIFPYLAGWECARAKDYARAVVYFERAAAVPDVPPHVRRMVAGMFYRSGNLDEAIEEWKSIHDDPASDDSSRSIAARQIRTLRIRRDVGILRAAVERFRAAAGRNPTSLDELARSGLVAAVPLDPEGKAYSYDRRSGQVAAASERVLGEP